MRDEYDFSKAKKNPYARKLKKQVTIRLETDVIDYFKELAADSGIPYQSLISLFLRDCADSKKKIRIKWASSARSD
jgi:predicted DNA binding CopG/RHH family protein